ncbi:MAG: hypothetical protein PWR11_651 [Bacillota bacterium]|nr:hypothetical protein [Bacillota bacterium]
MVREKVSIRLEPELTKWLRRRAVERHVTVSALVEECVRRARDDERLELLVRASLHGVSLLLAGEGAGPGEARRVKVELVRAGREEMGRAQSGSHTRPGESEAHSAESSPAD